MADPLREVRCPRCRGVGSRLVERIVGRPQEPRPRSGLLSRAFWDAAHTTGALYTVRCATCAGSGTVLSFTTTAETAAAVVDSLAYPGGPHG